MRDVSKESRTGASASRKNDICLFCIAGGARRLSLSKSFAVNSFDDKAAAPLTKDGSVTSSDTAQHREHPRGLDSIPEADGEGPETVRDVVEATMSSLRQPRADSISDSSAASAESHEKEVLGRQGEGKVESVDGKKEDASDEGWIGWAKGLKPWGRQAEQQGSVTEPDQVLAYSSCHRHESFRNDLHAPEALCRLMTAFFTGIQRILVDDTYCTPFTLHRITMCKRQSMLQGCDWQVDCAVQIVPEERAQIDNDATKRTSKVKPSWWSKLPFWREEQSAVDAAEAEARREAPSLCRHKICKPVFCQFHLRNCHGCIDFMFCSPSVSIHIRDSFPKAEFCCGTASDRR